MRQHIGGERHQAHLGARPRARLRSSGGRLPHSFCMLPVMLMRAVVLRPRRLGPERCAVVLLCLAAALPGVQRIEASKVWPKEDGSPTPCYRLLSLYFADYDTASAA